MSKDREMRAERAWAAYDSLKGEVENLVAAAYTMGKNDALTGPARRTPPTANDVRRYLSGKR